MKTLLAGLLLLLAGSAAAAEPLRVILVGDSTMATEFPANLARYVVEARALGATPVLLTPLTRRSFRGELLNNDLLDWADAVRRVAATAQVPLLDLNAQSAMAVQKMGEAEADTLAMPTQFDRTHRGSKGAALFSQLVLRELTQLLPNIALELRPGSN